MSLDTNDQLDKRGGKPLLNRSFDPKLGAYINHYDQGVSARETLPAQSYGLLNLELGNERNVGEARFKKDVATFVALNNRDRHQGENELDRFAVSILERRETLNHQTLPALSFLDLDVKIESVDTANNHWVIRTATAFIPLHRKYVDDELGLPIDIVEEVIDIVANPNPPTNTPGAYYQVQQVDGLRGIKTTIGIVGYDVTKFNRTYFDDFSFGFPAILYAGTPSNGFIASQRRSIFKLDLRVRNAFTAKVHAKVIETLLTATEMTALIAVPAAASWPSAGHLGDDTHLADIFTPIAQDLSYDGLLFSFHVNNVLNDAFNPTATTNSADTYYGAGVVVDNPSFAATNYTASQYIANIGNYVTAQEFIKPWKYGLYWRRRIQVKLM